jgi:hypothetical protein
VAGIGVLTSVYAAANHDLTGWHLLVAILFGGASLALIVEAFYRSQAHISWLRVALIGALCAVVSLTFVALPTGHHATAAGNPTRSAGSISVPTTASGGLEFSMRQVPRELFHLAFYKPIPLPRPKEDSSQLRRRGGVEVGEDNFRMILADRGTEPISVLSVRLEVLGSAPRPEGTMAYEFSQGAEGVGHLTATIARARRGAIAHLYESSRAPSDPAQRKTTPPYFETTYILLRPGEAYPGSLTVRAEPHRLIHFRFVAEGRSAGHRFVRRSPVYALVGGTGLPSEERYDRTYVDGQFPGICTATPESPWYDTRFAYGTGAMRCPEGAEAPEEIPMRDPAAYPSGRFRLDLGIELAAQSAEVDGVALGGPPAADPQSPVALPLLRALGAWSTCVDHWPVPGFWTAAWERWGLFLIFSGEGSQACTPQSRSPVRQIELSEAGQVIHTDLGAIAIGTRPAKIPPAIREDATVEVRSDESVFLLKGVSVCDPQRLVDRPQILSEHAGGILALHIRKPRFMTLAGREVSSSEIDKAVSTLPEEEC